ncbi:helix-turn-helix domain-containing protein [Rhizobium leucaenae]|uniref:helix-turn-helix domain-containing protein n=1 Tax=Rhizobium leucaenae TaxID=29450 RepID=UPI001560DB50
MTDLDIRSLRDKLDWTQDQLAEYLGVDRSTVSRIENGRRIAGPVYRLLLALMTDVSEVAKSSPAETACGPP